MVEIRFGCPVCQKYFVSMSAAQSHISEHKQAWKCGHCVMLFGSPALALQHWKEIHPGLQGLLESIDSPSLVVEKLHKGITINRLELNAKSQSKEKQAEFSGNCRSKHSNGFNDYCDKLIRWHLFIRFDSALSFTSAFIPIQFSSKNSVQFKLLKQLNSRMDCISCE